MEIDNCGDCGGNVEIFPESGGQGTGDLISYSAECKNCNFVLDELGCSTGRRATAIKEYNDYLKAQAT